MTTPEKPTPRKSPAKKVPAKKTAASKPPLPEKAAPAPKESAKEEPQPERKHTQTAEERAKAMLARMIAMPWETWKSSAGSIEELCDYIVAGGSLNSFATHRQFSYTNMVRWLAADVDRAASYAHAREERSHILVDEMVSIADEMDCNFVRDPETGKLVAVQMDKTAIARNKLRIETRQWYAGRMHARYKEKTQVDVTTPISAKTDAELLAEFARLGMPIPSLVPQPPVDTDA